jgi:hypothetical protein
MATSYDPAPEVNSTATIANTTVPAELFLQALRALTNNSRPLSAVQKRVATQVLAIRNAHGDLRTRALIEPPPVLAGTRLTFTKLPTGTTKADLLKADGTVLKNDVPISSASTALDLTTQEAQALFAVETLDANDVLLGIGFVTRG